MLAVLVALFALLEAADYFLAETMALAWHVRNGFHAEIGGIRVHVPLSYEAEDPHGLSFLDITRLPARFRDGGSGVITINFMKQPSPEAIQSREEMLAQGRATLKRTKVGESKTAFAGRPGICVEYVMQLKTASIPPVDEYGIQCQFNGDVNVSLIGSDRLRNDFYEIIQSAEPVKGKN